METTYDSCLFLIWASSSKRSLLISFKNAFSIFGWSNWSYNSSTYSLGILSFVVFSLNFLIDLAIELFRPFFRSLNVSGPTALKRFIQLQINAGLIIPSCKVISLYESSLVKYNSTTNNFFWKNIFLFFWEQIILRLHISYT